MAAGGLQRSAASFRRQGSSGLVWDDKFLSGDLNRMRHKEAEDHKEKPDLKQSQTVMMQRSRSEGGGRPYRPVRAPSPALDPPSPKVSGCGLCGFFGKPVAAQKPRPKNKPNKRKC